MVFCWYSACILRIPRILFGILRNLRILCGILFGILRNLRILCGILFGILRNLRILSGILLGILCGIFSGILIDVARDLAFSLRKESSF